MIFSAKKRGVKFMYNESDYIIVYDSDGGVYLEHHGVKGQR